MRHFARGNARELGNRGIELATTGFDDYTASVMDWTLELVVIPVTDVDRAKRFYEKLGFRLDIDYVVKEEFRAVQFTPECPTGKTPSTCLGPTFR